MKTSIYPFLVILFFIASCGSNEKENVPVAGDKFDTVISYIEINGDFINSESAPGVISADKVYNSKSNIQVIDIRPEEMYGEGHIKGASNIRFISLIEYFENSINPSAFDTIVLVSADGQASFFASTLLRLLGYNNVFSLRWGMCEWDSTYAANIWMKNLSSAYAEKLDTINYKKEKGQKYPEIISNKNSAYEIIRERAQSLLEKPFNNYTVTAEDVFKSPEKYYIINYWPFDLYKSGHIKGSFQFYPKKSLNRSAYLSSLPADKPVVVYCNSGNQSAAVAAYLRILGYDAYTLINGCNGFMYNKLDKEKAAFSEKFIMNFPLEKTNNSSGEIKIETKKIATSQGGC
jgi:rhodanese-related sulfurtransferase